MSPGAKWIAGVVALASSLSFYNVKNNEGIGFIVSLKDPNVTNKDHPQGYKDIECWMIDAVGTGSFPRLDPVVLRGHARASRDRLPGQDDRG